MPEAAAAAVDEEEDELLPSPSSDMSGRSPDCWGLLLKTADRWVILGSGGSMSIRFMDEEEEGSTMKEEALTVSVVWSSKTDDDDGGMLLDIGAGGAFGWAEKNIVVQGI